MNNTQMMAALAALPDPELLQAGKITNPLGDDAFYSARTVVKMLEEARNAEREACAGVLRDSAKEMRQRAKFPHIVEEKAQLMEHAADLVSKRSNAE